MENLSISIDIDKNGEEYFDKYINYKNQTRSSINECIKKNDYKKAFLKLIDVLATVEKKDVYEIIDYYSQLSPKIINRLQSPISSPTSSERKDSMSIKSLHSEEV